jgi:hypothetical protein
MATWTRWSRGLAAGALAAAALSSGAGGCYGGGNAPSAGESYGGTAGSSSSGSASGQPMLVVVDTGESFAASSMAGGQGVGVFVEYQAGGHWAIQWTCDTALTNLDCQFQIGASLLGAPLSSVDASADASSGTPDALTALTSELQSQNGQVTQPSPAEVMATTTTFTAVDGMTFDAPPGATIVVDAKVNGEDNGAFLFFVQDDKVNGGYQGTLSDPLMFQPSSP